MAVAAPSLAKQGWLWQEGQAYGVKSWEGTVCYLAVICVQAS